MSSLSKEDEGLLHPAFQTEDQASQQEHENLKTKQTIQLPTGSFPSISVSFVILEVLKYSYFPWGTCP